MQSLRRFRDYSRQILSLIQLVMLRSGVVRGYSAQAPFPQAPGFAPVPSIGAVMFGPSSLRQYRFPSFICGVSDHTSYDSRWLAD